VRRDLSEQQPQRTTAGAGKDADEARVTFSASLRCARIGTGDMKRDVRLFACGRRAWYRGQANWWRKIDVIRVLAEDGTALSPAPLPAALTRGGAISSFAKSGASRQHLAGSAGSRSRTNINAASQRRKRRKQQSENDAHQHQNKSISGGRRMGCSRMLRRAHR